MFGCPYCGSHFSADRGEWVKCPFCDREFISVPGFEVVGQETAEL